MVPRGNFLGLGIFVRRRQVLEVIEARTREGKESSYRTLVDELWLTPDAAVSHLKRLWAERFIRSTSYPFRFSDQLGPGESIRDLSFTLARRGRERLRWYRERDRMEDEE